MSRSIDPVRRERTATNRTAKPAVAAIATGCSADARRTASVAGTAAATGVGTASGGAGVAAVSAARGARAPAATRAVSANEGDRGLIVGHADARWIARAAVRRQAHATVARRVRF